MSRETFDKILKILADSFPEPVDISKKYREFGGIYPLYAHLKHLKEIGLIQADISESPAGLPEIRDASLSSKGITHMGLDGGLGDEVNAVTIKIHESTIRGLLESKIQESDLAPSQKKRILQQLADMPSLAIKEISLRLMRWGLDNAHRLPELFE